MIVLPPSVKATLPVGALPVTVAVKVTLAPTSDGLAELARAVVLGGVDHLRQRGAGGAGVAVTAIGGDDVARADGEAALLQVAFLELAEPAGNATAPQPVIVLPSSVKPTLPVERCRSPSR